MMIIASAYCFDCVLNVKALVGAFSVITNLRMELFQALVSLPPDSAAMCHPISARSSGVTGDCRSRDCDCHNV